jgi:hypothetical protein
MNRPKLRPAIALSNNHTKNIGLQAEHNVLTIFWLFLLSSPFIKWLCFIKLKGCHQGPSALRDVTQ